PGSFKRFCQLIHRRMITEFNYRMGDPERAHIFVGVQVDSDQDREDLIATLRGHDYPVADMTDNEIAKLHIRYMVGGRVSGASDGLVYRFEFADRPGALFNFLSRLGGNWNISMFHYRNHGAAFGRVLAGFEVPAGERKDVPGFLEGLGYEYSNESDNPAYQFFLRG